MAQPPRPSGSPQHPRPSGTPAPGGSPDRRALLEAYQNLVRAEAEKKAAGPELRGVRPNRVPFWTFTAVLILALGAMLLTEPAWLFTQPKAESREVQEASLRVQMFVEIERLERFRADSGRPPATAAEAGIAAGTNILYEAEGTGYRLLGRNGPITLTYNAGMAPADFLGNAYQIIRARETR